MEDVSDNGAGRRGDDPDGAWQEGQRLFMLLIEQALSGEFLLSLFQQSHQRADASRTHIVGDQLIIGSSGISRHPPRRDNLQAFFRTEGQARDLSFPHNRIEDRFIVLQVSIHMTGACDRHATKFPAHADMVIGRLNRSLQRRRQL